MKIWCEETWSNIKKALEDGGKIVFADESAFYLLPFVSKSYAPINSPPILRHKLTREHLSVISGITEDGKLYANIHTSSITGAKSVDFLKHLLTHIPGKILVVWDGAMIHRCNKVKQFLTECEDDRIRLEKLPAYSPELNPDEGVWQYLKCVCLKNVACASVKELGRALRRSIRRFRAKKHLITACFKKSRLCLIIKMEIYNCSNSCPRAILRNTAKISSAPGE